MAEIFLLPSLTEATISHVVLRVSDLLIKEARSLAAVTDDVELITKELERIQSFLRSSVGQQHSGIQDDRVRNWVSEIRDLAAEIEDFLDIYILKSKTSIAKPFHLMRLRKRMRTIKVKLQSIFDSRSNYGIPLAGGSGPASAGASPSVTRLRRSYPDEGEDSFCDVGVGLVQTVDALTVRLVDEVEERLCAVPILGMPGLGKTTLAKRAFYNIRVQRQFERLAWVLISPDYVAKDVFSEVLLQVGGEGTRRERDRLKTMEEVELIRLVKEKLQGKRYLLVFDDVQRVNDVNSIRQILPLGRPGSKVVFTTRMADVASSVDPGGGAPVIPPVLTPEESWELLRRQAFPINDVFGTRRCTMELERIGREMAKRCGGLPLAAVTLGQALRNKSSELEWKEMEKDLEQYLTSHGSLMGKTLAQCYHDLPYYLKPCFLYLGCFPEDQEINRRQLIRLWIAEGFVVPIWGRTAEEVAEQYLNVLINRSMVLVNSRAKTCLVHPLMRNFCIFNARMEGFLDVIQKHDNVDHRRDKIRRISVHAGCDLHQRQVHRHLRSLVLFDSASPDGLARYCRSKNLRLVRVIEAGFHPRSSCNFNVPVEIGSLICLRYLGVRGGGMVILPSSIENLCNLMTIDLRDNAVVLLPVEIFRLKRLKHLLLPSGTTFPYDHTFLTYYTSDTSQVQTLKRIEFGKFLLRGKVLGSEFSSLRKLGVEFTSNEQVRLFVASPNFDFRSLHSLYLSGIEFSGLRLLAQCAALSKLHLVGRLSHDCHALDFLPDSLTKLTLRNSRITELDPMRALERLPQLMFLRLENAYSGPEMVCGAGGFVRLETLLLRSMDTVSEWRVDRNAMQNINRLYIKDMPNLRIPPQLLSNDSLQILNEDW